MTPCTSWIVGIVRIVGTVGTMYAKNEPRISKREDLSRQTRRSGELRVPSHLATVRCEEARRAHAVSAPAA